MPEQDTSGGGGTTTIVCTPSPNDEVAIIHNLIKRISDMERFLSQLIGMDVNANNLSELATDIGNILNGTIILPGTGSPLGQGGSIPVPDGFTGTVISGNVITTWTDGVVSFEVIPSSGQTVGSTNKSAILTGSTSTTYTNPSPNTQLEIGTIVRNDSTLVSLASNTITVNKTGKYIFTAAVSFDYPAGAGADKRASVYFGITAGVMYGDMASQFEVTSGQYITTIAATVEVTSGDTFKLFATDTGSSGSTRTIDVSSVGINYLGV